AGLEAVGRQLDLADFQVGGVRNVEDLAGDVEASRRERFEVSREVVRHLREHRLEGNFAQDGRITVVVRLLVELDRPQDGVLDGRYVEGRLSLHVKGVAKGQTTPPGFVGGA